MSFSDLRVVDLRAKCKAAGLSSTGRKAELVARLREEHEAVAASAPSPAPTSGDSAADTSTKEEEPKEEQGGDAVEAKDSVPATNESVPAPTSSAEVDTPVASRSMEVDAPESVEGEKKSGEELGEPAAAAERGRASPTLKRPRERSASEEREAKYRALENDRRKQSRSRPSYTVFVKDLHFDVDERDLFEFFSLVGNVCDICLVRDQHNHKSLGMAFVEFWEEESVEVALKLHGTKVHTFAISIERGKQLAKTEEDRERSRESRRSTKRRRVLEKGSGCIIVCNVPDVIGSEELDAIFEEIGKITKITKQPDTSGVYRVVYENSEDANLAVDQLHDLELMNARLEVLLEATYLAKTSSTSSSSSSSAPVDETSGIGMVDALSRLSSKAAQSTSVYVLMSNLFAPEGADQDEEENWQAEIRDDVQVECGEIAGEPVTACCLDPSSQGCVYIHMPSHDMALKIINTFNNRWFAERQIGAALITKDLFESKMKMFGADE